MKANNTSAMTSVVLIFVLAATLHKINAKKHQDESVLPIEEIEAIEPIEEIESITLETKSFVKGNYILGSIYKANFEGHDYICIGRMKGVGITHSPDCQHSDCKK